MKRRPSTAVNVLRDADDVIPDVFSELPQDRRVGTRTRGTVGVGLKRRNQDWVEARIGSACWHHNCRALATASKAIALPTNDHRLRAIIIVIARTCACSRPKGVIHRAALTPRRLSVCPPVRLRLASAGHDGAGGGQHEKQRFEARARAEPETARVPPAAAQAP